MVTAGATLAYTENVTAAVVDATITLADVDDTTLSGATVSIGTGFTAGDVLGFVTQNGITGSYNSTTGILTLTGTTTVAHYQAALRSVTYESTSDNPTSISATRTVNWAVDDGDTTNHASNVATSTITITPLNDAADITPVTVNLTETNAVLTTGGTLTISDVDSPATFVAQTNVAGTGGYGKFTVAANGTWTYATNNAQDQFVASQTYTDMVTVTSADGTTSTITVNILGTNDAPVDGNEENEVIEDTPLIIAATDEGGLLRNFRDVDGATQVITSFTVAGINVTNPAGSSVPINGVGTIKINDDGSYEFTPAPNYTGAIPVITYTVSDGNGGTDTSTLTLTMVPVDDVFTDNNEDTSTPEDTPKTGNVIDTALTSNDGAITVTSFSIAGVTGTFNAGSSAATIPNVGSITIGTNGAYTFTPLPNWNGVVPTITYSLSDGFGVAETSDLVITVTPVSDDPVAVDDHYTMLVDDGVITLTPLTHSDDSDPDGDVLTIISINGITLNPGMPGEVQIIPVPDGKVEVSASGVITFTPDMGFNGTVTFPYVISDGHGRTATANEIINIIPAPIFNPPPPIELPDRLPLNEVQRQTESMVGHHPHQRIFEERPIELGKYEFHTVVLNFNGQFGGINQFSPPTVESTFRRGELEYSNHTPYHPFDRVADAMQVGRHLDDMASLVNNESDFGLRNALLLPTLEADLSGELVYQIPENTFVGGKGDLVLVAVLRDGKPLPKWIKFNPASGKIEANMPKDVIAPIEITLIATDAKGEQAKANIKIKPTIKNKALVGKSSLANQFKSAMMLNR